MRIYVKSGMTEADLDYAIENGRPFDMESFKKYKTAPPAPGAIKVKDVKVGDIIENTESSEQIDVGEVFQVLDIDYTDPDGISYSYDPCKWTFLCRYMDRPETFNMYYFETEGDDYIGVIAYTPSDFVAQLPEDYQAEYERQIRDYYRDEPDVDEIAQNFRDSRLKDVDDLFREIMSSTDVCASDDIDLDEYEYIANRKGYQLYRKIVNGKGQWVAQDQNEKYPPFPITYDQALGYEPIAQTDIEKLGEDIGRILFR